MHKDQSIFRENLFTGKSAIITGGGTGIGLSIAGELRLLGANVTICSRNIEKLETGKEQLIQIEGPGEVDLHICNIRDKNSIDTAVDYAKDRFGAIDILVNNAGGNFVSPAIKIDQKGWNSVIETNLTGTFLMSQAVVQKSMKKQKSGAIVNILAQMWNGFPLMAHTGASRAGVENLTKTLAVELSPLGIRVNSVAVGVILTTSGQENYPDEYKSWFLESAKHVPAGRVGTPREAASAVVYLLSKAANFITGTTIRVDGGEPLFGHAVNGLMRPTYKPEPTEPYE